MHLRTLVAATAIAAFASLVTAQAKQHCVPDSNPATGSSNAWPFTTNGNAGPNWRYQFLIQASQMPSNAITITDIAFAPISTTLFTATQCQIRMANTNAQTLTTLSCYDNVLGPSATTVFNGPMTYQLTANTWSSMGLQNSFTWDGTSNLVVEIRYRSATSVSRTIHTASITRSWTNGWNSNPDPYNSQCPEFASTSSGPKVCFTYDDIRIVGSNTPQVGMTETLSLIADPSPGKPYQCASSLGLGPIQVDRRQLNLSPDNMMVASIFGQLPTVFQNYTGVLSARGRGTAQVNIPPFGFLVGIDIHNAFVVLDAGSPSGIEYISTTYTFKIAP